MSSAPSQALNHADIGVRCHDVHQGMAIVDTRSAYIAEIHGRGTPGSGSDQIEIHVAGSAGSGGVNRAGRGAGVDYVEVPTA